MSAINTEQDASANQIILNADPGNNEITYKTDGSPGFYVAPIRLESQTHALYYDTATKEITYDASSTPLPSGTTFSEYLYWDNTSNSWEIDGDKVHIGSDAGKQQSDGSIAIGKNAGSNQTLSIAIGKEAGMNGQGLDSVAIGNLAGKGSAQPANSIIINASGNSLESKSSNSFYVKPIRQSDGNSILNYDTNSGEITYGRPTTQHGLFIFADYTLNGTTPVPIDISNATLTIGDPNYNFVNENPLTSSTLISFSDLSNNFTNGIVEFYVDADINSNNANNPVYTFDLSVWK
jgi:hypothetical protein